MTLAAAAKPLKWKNWTPLSLAAVSFILLGTGLPAHGQCVSPSAAAGATTTTVYRCPEEGAVPAAQPETVVPDNSVTVERGSSDIPWFGPKPTKTADPLAAPTPAETVVKTEPLPVNPPAAAPQTPAMPQAVEAAPPAQAPETPAGAPAGTSAPDASANAQATDKTPASSGDAEAGSSSDDAEAADAEAGGTAVSPPDATSTEPAVKAKATKTKHAKASHKKLKLAKSKRVKNKPIEEKPGETKTVKTVKTESKTARAKAKAKAEEAEAAADTEKAKSEPAKSDDKVILMTRKNMPLGTRIKNFLGL